MRLLQFPVQEGTTSVHSTLTTTDYGKMYSKIHDRCTYPNKEAGYSDRRAVSGKICEVAKLKRERGEERNKIKQNQYLGVGLIEGDSPRINLRT